MSDLSKLAPTELRQLCRTGTHTGPTAGLAPGILQANLVILPREVAYDFLVFCVRNRKSCPLIEVLDSGSFAPTSCPGADLRSDLPGYRIYRDGKLSEEVTDIREYWRPDLVSFLIGCSFSFEAALMEQGIKLQHVERGCNVPMYRTNIPCAGAGRMQGRMVVSMRPLKPADIARAVEICERFPNAHGAPVHVGSPEHIGIADIMQPDYGDAPVIADGEVPVFWACGVTPQAVVLASKLAFCITHAPGKMLVTDLRA